MARRLSRNPTARRRALALLVLPVLLVHGWLGERLVELHQDWGEAATPMPARLSVSYVRELKATAAPQPPARKPPRLAPPSPAPGINTPALEPLPDLAGNAGLEPLPEPVPIPEPVAETPPPAASAPENADPDGEPGPEWPLSTRLSYALTGNYRGPVTGDASVEWVRQGRRYQVHLDLSIGPGFAPLIARRMSSDGRLTAAGITPERYDEETRVLLSSRGRATVRFEGGRLTLANGATEPAPAGVQDSASQFVHLTWLFLTGRQTLRVGQVVELPLVLPRRLYRWGYEVVGEELLQTPMGPLPAWHLKPTLAPGGGDLAAEVWLAPSLQYLPVRLLIRQDAQTHIDLMLKGPPLQAAP